MRHPRPAALFPALLASLMLLLAGPVGAWGPQGHRLVAALAWADLTPQAQAEVAILLAGEADPTLPGIANWADQLRAENPDLGKRSASWHYVNIGEEACQYDAARDCPGGNCVVGAIDAQLAILADRSQPVAARRQALKFVVHFVGDVHQPLHAGFGHDKGGNTVQASDPAEWAQASCAIALQPGLYPPRASIGDSYVNRWRPVAETRLRQGGVHLAVLLNQALAH